MIFFILFFGLKCDCWLGEYFNLAGNEYFIVQKAAVEKLETCVQSKMEWWEIKIRERHVNNTVCQMAKRVFNCTYISYQDPVAEYIKHLVEDSKTLCKQINSGNNLAEKCLIVLCIVLLLVSPFIIAWRIHRRWTRNHEEVAGLTSHQENNEEDIVEYPLQERKTKSHSGGENW